MPTMDRGERVATQARDNPTKRYARLQTVLMAFGQSVVGSVPRLECNSKCVSAEQEVNLSIHAGNGFPLQFVASPKTCTFLILGPESKTWFPFGGCTSLLFFTLQQHPIDR